MVSIDYFIFPEFSAGIRFSVGFLEAIGFQLLTYRGNWHTTMNSFEL
jgi:hypothetical protein